MVQASSNKCALYNVLHYTVNSKQCVQVYTVQTSKCSQLVVTKASE